MYENKQGKNRFLRCVLLISEYGTRTIFNSKRLLTIWERWYTVLCRYKVVKFSSKSLQNTSQRSPIRQDMGCILWVLTLIYTLSQSLQWCIPYHVILDHVITVPVCIVMLLHTSDSHITGPFHRESTSQWWTTSKRASTTELWHFLCFQPEKLSNKQFNCQWLKTQCAHVMSL